MYTRLGTFVLLVTTACSNGPGAGSPAPPPAHDAASAAADEQPDQEPDQQGSVMYQFSGLMALSGVADLPSPTEHPVGGYPGKAFHLGAITDADSWAAVSPALPEADFPDIDWGSQAVVYAVLDAQTNALDFADWTVDDTGQATLVIDWRGIEPHYVDATPGVFVLVDSASIGSVTVKANRGPGGPPDTLGAFELP